MFRGLLCVIFVTVGFSQQAQHHFGAKADLGTSKLAWKNYYLDTGSTAASQFGLSWRAGLHYAYHFKRFSGIGADLMVTNIKGKQVIKGTDPTNVAITVTISEDLTYLQFPVYYSAHIKKFSLSAGACFLLNIKNSARSTQESKKGIYVSTGDALLVKLMWVHIARSITGYTIICRFRQGRMLGSPIFFMKNLNSLNGPGRSYSLLADLPITFTYRKKIDEQPAAETAKRAAKKAQRTQRTAIPRLAVSGFVFQSSRFGFVISRFAFGA